MANYTYNYTGYMSFKADPNKQTWELIDKALDEAKISHTRAFCNGNLEICCDQRYEVDKLLRHIEITLQKNYNGYVLDTTILRTRKL
jgi:hypothetical protein